MQSSAERFQISLQDMVHAAHALNRHCDGGPDAEERARGVFRGTEIVGFRADETPTLGQIDDSEQSSQRGRRATHTRRPWWIKRWLKSTHWERGTISINSRSICSGAVFDANPNRFASRRTWVSTTIPVAIPNAVPSTTFAVLRPTPAERGQLIQCAGHLAMMIAHHLIGHRQQAASLGAKKTCRTNQRFKVAGEAARQTRGIRKTAEQFRGDHVDPGVRALRGKDGRHQKLVGVHVSQGASGRGIGLLEPAQTRRAWVLFLTGDGSTRDILVSSSIPATGGDKIKRRQTDQAGPPCRSCKQNYNVSSRGRFDN